MRSLSQRTVTILVGAAVVAGIAGCQSDEPELPELPPPPATADPTTEPTGTADGDRAGDAETGFTVAFPAGWVELDPDEADLAAQAGAAGLSEELADAIPQIVGQIADLGGFFALDIQSATPEFVANANGYCAPGSGAADLAALGASAQSQYEAIGAEEVSSTETTIGSLDAVRMTYTLTFGGRPADGTLFAFFGSAGRDCFLTFTTTPEDTDRDRFDDIAATVELV